MPKTRVEPAAAVVRPLPSHRWAPALAWTLTLSVSMLPEILWESATGNRQAWMLTARLALLALVLVAGSAWDAARPLRHFCFLLPVLFLVEGLRGMADDLDWLQRWFGGAPSGFTGQMLATQVLRVAGAGVMVCVLLSLRYRPRDFFLARGDLNAPAAPVRWLGIKEPVGWARLGMISALCISLGTLAFLVMAGRPNGATVARALPLLPWVLVFAAMNAFAEELSYRGALLAPINGVVGPRQAILLTAAFFGIGHYYGVPYGPAGVAMAGLLGWYLGKCMVETRGFVWPWLIHFLQDVMIFFFLAAGGVTPGGR